MGKRYLVTGGAGFVGGGVEPRADRGGQRRYGCGRSVERKTGKCSGRRQFLELDLAGRIGLWSLDGSSLRCRHSLRQRCPMRSVQEIREWIWRANRLHLNLLEFAGKAGGSSVFSYELDECVRQGRRAFPPQTEPCSPDSFCAVHKLASGDYVRIYAQEYGLEPTVFRLYTTYGCGQESGQYATGTP